MKKRREMIENNTPRDHIEYVEICKTKHGKEIQEQDKIMERIEEFYSELYDSDRAVTIQIDPE